MENNIHPLECSNKLSFSKQNACMMVQKSTYNNHLIPLFPFFFSAKLQHGMLFQNFA